MKYRVSRNSTLQRFWAVQSKRWWWPFWIEEIGLLNSKEEALEMVKLLGE